MYVRPLSFEDTVILMSSLPDLLLPMHSPLSEHLGEQMGALPYLFRLGERTSTQEGQMV